MLLFDLKEKNTNQTHSSALHFNSPLLVFGKCHRNAQFSKIDYSGFDRKKIENVEYFMISEKNQRFHALVDWSGVIDEHDEIPGLF